MKTGIRCFESKHVVSWKQVLFFFAGSVFSYIKLDSVDNTYYQYIHDIAPLLLEFAAATAPDDYKSCISPRLLKVYSDQWTSLMCQYTGNQKVKLPAVLRFND